MNNNLKRKIDNIKNEIIDQYLIDDRPWIIGFSGGKDSTALLQIVWQALQKLPKNKLEKSISVLCNDTLVENPVIVSLIEDNLEKIKITSQKAQIPINVVKTTPKLNDSFWVNMIGRGYPAPNNSFRWCTDRLKIKPTSHYIKNEMDENGEVIILLGARSEESSSRKKSLEKYSINNQRLRRHNDLNLAYVYTPLINLSTVEIWKYLLNTDSPWGASNQHLYDIYKISNDEECPLVIDTSTPSCGNSRFGCWICTVVKLDKSMTSLVDSGEQWMKPLLELRDWLQTNRDNPEYRMDYRRNGTHSPSKGPYTIDGRMIILEKLLKAEKKVGFKLISEFELKTIQNIWNTDGFNENIMYIYQEV